MSDFAIAGMLLAFLIGLAIGVGIPLAVVLYGWFGSGPAARSQSFIVEEGSSVSGVAAQLEKAGAIGSAARFKVGARIFGGSDPVQAGEFEIPARASTSAILELLQHGRPVQRLITVTEGMPSIIVAEKIAAGMQNLAVIAAQYQSGRSAVPAVSAPAPAKTEA